MTEALPKTMTIQQALSTIKLLEKRIERLTGEIGGKPASIGIPAGFKNGDDFVRFVDSKLQALSTLLQQRDTLRSAITRANSQVPVTIMGVTMTIAVALNMKLGMQLRKDILETITHNQTSILARWDNMEEMVRSRAEERMAEIFGKEADPSSDKYREMFEEYVKRNVKPLYKSYKLINWMEKEATQIETFLSQIDYVLTTANVTTTISDDNKESPVPNPVSAPE